MHDCVAFFAQPLLVIIFYNGIKQVFPPAFAWSCGKSALTAQSRFPFSRTAPHTHPDGLPITHDAVIRICHWVLWSFSFCGVQQRGIGARSWRIANTRFAAMQAYRSIVHIYTYLCTDFNVVKRRGLFFFIILGTHTRLATDLTEFLCHHRATNSSLDICHKIRFKFKTEKLWP